MVRLMSPGTQSSFNTCHCATNKACNSKATLVALDDALPPLRSMFSKCSITRQYVDTSWQSTALPLIELAHILSQALMIAWSRSVDHVKLSCPIWLLAGESELGPHAFSHDMLSHCSMLFCLSHMLPRAFMHMQYMPAGCPRPLQPASQHVYAQARSQLRWEI